MTNNYNKKENNNKVNKSKLSRSEEIARAKKRAADWAKDRREKRKNQSCLKSTTSSLNFKSPQREKGENQTTLPGHSLPVGATELISSQSYIIPSAVDTLHTEVQSFNNNNYISPSDTAIAVCNSEEKQLAFKDNVNLTIAPSQEAINLNYYFHLLSQHEELNKQIKQVEAQLSINSSENLNQEKCPVSRSEALLIFLFVWITLLWR